MLYRDCVIKDIIGKLMRVMDVFFFCIKYLKDIMIKVMVEKKIFDIIDINIDFVIIVSAIWGDVVKLFMREVVIDVR